AALARGPGANEVDEHAAHGARGNREEVLAVLPRNLARPGQAHEHFVHERRGFERRAGALATHAARGLAPELVVEDRGDLTVGRLVAGMPRLQQPRHLASS